MGQVLEQDRRTVRRERKTGLRPRALVVVVTIVFAIFVGVSGGLLATTLLSRPSGLSVQEIQQRRMEGLADYHESLWSAEPQRIQDARARGMVEYHQRLWQSQQTENQ
jgi:hypothetical protein